MSDRSKRDRIGVIGLGRMGIRHVEAARGLGLEVVAVHDPFEGAFGFGQNPELRAIAQPSLQAFFAQDLDAAVIATTATTRLPLVLTGLECGLRRFLVEKPMTSDPADALVMRRAAEAAGARIVVNHGRRYFPAYRMVRERLIGSAEFGDLRMVAVTQGAGGLGCLGVHYFDLCNYLFDARPERVHAELTRPAGVNPRGADFDDPGGIALLSYPGGRRGVVEMGDDVGVIGQIELRFECGLIRIVDESRPWTALVRRPDMRSRPNAFYGVPLEPFVIEDFAVLSVVEAAGAALSDALSDAPARVGADVGVDAMTCLAACHLSHRRRAPVDLPLAEADMALGLRIP